MVYMMGWVVHMWQCASKGQIQESVLPLHHMGPTDQTRVILVDDKDLYPLTILPGPMYKCLIIILKLRKWHLKGDNYSRGHN